MLDQFSRTRLLLGSEGLNKLHNAHVAVFGVGGVGGYTVEALARSGVGAIDLIDNDTVCITNINRQLTATLKTVGRYKTEVEAEHIAEINPECRVRTFNTFFLPDTAGRFDFTEYDYIVDAIDTVTGKLCIIENAYKCNTPVISALGAGNKLDPCAFEVADIYSTSVCPLARVMRYECKKRGIRSLKCVYSKEKPVSPSNTELSGYKEQRSESDTKTETTSRKRAVPGTLAYIPAVAGLIIAGEVIKDLITRVSSS